MARLAASVGRVVGAASLVALLLTVAPRAHAFEKQFHVGASFGYEALFNASSPHGFGGGVHFAYGLSDYFNLIAEVDATAHPSPDLTIVTSGVGAAYVVDVLRWVPWIGLEVGPGALLSLDSKCGNATTEPCSLFRFNAAIPFGLDYQISRSFAIGIQGRFQLLLLNGSPLETLGAYARAEYVWGY